MKPSAALRVYCLLLFACFFAPLQAQKFGFAYYDIDHLYDTVPALFYNDSDYTPSGRLQWTAARYRHKVAHIAAVLDSMRMPVVAVWGVENEAVTRDIAAACKSDYTYLHRTLNSLDGMDFALFYYGDRFYPIYDEPGRRYLYVEGRMGRDTVGLVLCSDTRMTDWVVRELREERPHAKLIVAGRIASRDAARLGLQDALSLPVAAGRGNVRRRGGWTMRDRIWADRKWKVTGGDVFARRYLIDRKNGTPIPTYERNVYRGGWSYALPVYAYLE